MATDTLSNTASTATPASIFCSSIGIPSLSKVFLTSIHLVEAVQRLLFLRRRVIDDVLVVDGRT